MAKSLLVKRNVVIAGAVVVAATGIYWLTQNDTSTEDTTQQTSQTSTKAEQSPQLPSALPSAVPIYPESSPVSSQESTSNGVQHMTFKLSTTDSVADVNTWYRGAMQQDGWSIKSDRVVGGYTILQAENENLFTSIQAARGENEGEVVISQQVQIR